MLKIKLVIACLFIVFALIFSSSRIVTPVVKSQKTLPVPTGVNASKGDYGNKVGLIWDAVRGAAQYRIFRNTINDPASAVSVGTSVSIIWFDELVDTSENYYWVPGALVP